MHALLTPLPDDGEECERGELRYRERIDSIPFLKGAREAQKALWATFQDLVKALPDYNTSTLIVRIETTTDPLMLWEIHQELERRGIPPIFRFTRNDDSGQMRFVTWLADLYWHTRRIDAPEKVYRSWKRLFGHADDSWHEKARIVFEHGWGRGALATYCTKGLCLTDNDRLDLMTIKTTRQLARQRQLKQSDEMRFAIASYATQHPDKTGKRRPNEITRDRCMIWKTYLLADQRDTLTAQMVTAIYGEKMTRLKVQQQIAAVKKAWEEFGPVRQENP
ncbi:hypothetical protein ACHAC9_16895 [Massilia sp. CMS3.1]|uniref:hypothetical protein n=1 Tax=Massilia sp. CMS3.1 TaxID=3373083 RepID=UPI003EE6CD00